MTVVAEVTKLLNSWDKLNSFGIKRVYSYYIPQSVPVAVENNEIYVSDVSSEPTEYGSNEFTTRNNVIQLNIMYGAQNRVSQDEVEKSISSFLLQENWRELPSGGRYPDPETGQITKILQFKKG